MKSTIALLLVMCSAVHAQTAGCGVQTGPLLPDLTVNAKTLANSFSVGRIYAGGCAVSDGYAPAVGYYNAVTLTTETNNIGQADLVLGDPSLCPTIFQPGCSHAWIAVHPTVFRIWTQAGITKWQATRDLNQPLSSDYNQTAIANLTASGDLLATGTKRWFCLEDEVGPGNLKKFDCGYQGLTRLCSDLYQNYYDGQWILIPPGLPKGVYVIEVQIDTECLFPDANRQNNSVTATWKYGGH